MGLLVIFILKAQGSFGCELVIGSHSVDRGKEDMLSLRDVLAEEESIWQVVYSHQDLFAGKWRAYWHLPFPTIPHWNAVYPRDLSVQPTQAELTEFRRLYAEKGATGHIINPQGLPGEFTVSQDEYFFLKQAVPVKPSAVDGKAKDFVIKETTDLELFARAVQIGFALPENFYSDFKEQMQKIKNNTPSSFLVAECDGNICGTISTFRTRSGYDFIMNLAVFPDYRKQGIAGALVSTVLHKCPKGTLVHTNSMELRKKLFPKLGFHSIGSVTYSPLVP